MSSSLRTSTNSTPSTISYAGSQQRQINQYAQPIRAGTLPHPTSNRTPLSQMNVQVPQIPDPDYSLSESDGEDENSVLLAHNTKMNEHIAVPAETSGNSNTRYCISCETNYFQFLNKNQFILFRSGSSSGSSSMPHSFSVDEIQKMRVKLKSSKSYPNELLRQQSEQQQEQRAATQHPTHPGAPQMAQEKSAQHKDKLGAALNLEEGDNSSSGVSSDHEVNMTQTHASNTNRMSSVKNVGDNNNTKESTTIQSAMKIPSNTQSVKIIDAINKKSINLPPLSNVTKKISSAVNAKVVVIEGGNCKQPLNDNDYYDDDELVDSPSPPSKGFQRNNSLTRKQAATIAMNRAIHTRNAVSLVQLPPPIETDSDSEQTATSKCTKND